MRRDTQIGIILGIVILVIIGVFLSTRTDVIEPQISDLVLSVGNTQQQKVRETSINDIIEKAESDRAKEAASTEIQTYEYQRKAEIVNSKPLEKQSIETDLKPNETFVETSKDNTSLEGKWEGLVEEKLEIPQTLETPQIVEELQFDKEQVDIDESQIAEEIPYEEEEEHQVASVDIPTRTIHKVKPNDSLFKIANIYYGNETKWYEIFEANRDNMSDPHSLYVGQELLIPDITGKRTEAQAYRPLVDKKPERNIAVNAITHTVQSGDSLYRIAGKYYDDPAMWEKIYKANKETIENQSVLLEGQKLIIPQ
ncbi:MAG: LysM peptidoglycan-binding domain-containing protein [Candidatus Brocadiaceae bacterium]|nr:LysM peptidoglycan-binding domain-containing protein [Candidatus Brocadiaceae bacterium]